jgi:hypothetical protein
MKITKKLINEIAKESKLCCFNGHGMSIFCNGDTMFAINSNDVCARGDGFGGWDYRVAYVGSPMTRLESAALCQKIFNEIHASYY